MSDIHVAPLRIAMMAVDRDTFREDSPIPHPIANLLHDTLEEVRREKAREREAD